MVYQLRFRLSLYDLRDHSFFPYLVVLAAAVVVLAVAVVVVHTANLPIRSQTYPIQRLTNNLCMRLG
ncbi:hypothetical protein D3C78_1647370 [compost metagenome]